jgi:hypothetical protein
MWKWFFKPSRRFLPGRISQLGECLAEKTKGRTAPWCGPLRYSRPMKSSARNSTRREMHRITMPANRALRSGKRGGHYSHTKE